MARRYGRFPKTLDRWRLKLHAWLVVEPTVVDGPYELRFRCTTRQEWRRAITLESKEAGTVAWIRQHVKPGDVFYDIGANIGLYTLMAAKRVGETGRVYAFEPHLGNAAALLHNVRLSDVRQQVRVFSCALDEREGFQPFRYYSDTPGSSLSQFGRGAEDDFEAVYEERKYAASVDALIRQRAIRPADHIKIDVDGNELAILRGMRDLLSGPARPKSIQVEINPGGRDEVLALLRVYGYRVAIQHDTADGGARRRAGVDPDTISYNALFVPQAAADQQAA